MRHDDRYLRNIAGQLGDAPAIRKMDEEELLELGWRLAQDLRAAEAKRQAAEAHDARLHEQHQQRVSVIRRLVDWLRQH